MPTPILPQALIGYMDNASHHLAQILRQHILSNLCKNRPAMYLWSCTETIIYCSRSFVERKSTSPGDEPVHLSIHMFLLICCLFKQTSNWYMFYMNAFQVRIPINVYVPYQWHWGPLVTTVTPCPTLDPDGTGVNGPTAVSTYYAMEILNI